jgi:hypothetical protein
VQRAIELKSLDVMVFGDVGLHPESYLLAMARHAPVRIPVSCVCVGESERGCSTGAFAAKLCCCVVSIAVVSFVPRCRVLVAQVQCAFWGNPVTSGLPSIDYFIAGEAFAAPAVTGEQFSEQVVTLRGSATYLYRPEVPDAAAAHDPTRRSRFLEQWELDAARSVLFCPQVP